MQEKVTSAQNAPPPRAGLFATCLAGVFRPRVVESALALVRRAGWRAETVRSGTCCGQPMLNAGDPDGARRAARYNIEQLLGYERVVLPSASCAGMFKVHYPRLFAGDPAWSARAARLAASVQELGEFLAAEDPDCAGRCTFSGKLVCHTSCSGLRELHLGGTVTDLLARVPGARLLPLREPAACCGFGGTFSVKFGAISARLADDKLADAASGAPEVLTGTDLGCLMHLEGRLRRNGGKLEVRHLAEVLAEGLDR